MIKKTEEIFCEGEAVVNGRRVKHFSGEEAGEAGQEAGEAGQAAQEGLHPGNTSRTPPASHLTDSPDGKALSPSRRNSQTLGPGVHRETSSLSLDKCTLRADKNHGMQLSVLICQLSG